RADGRAARGRPRGDSGADAARPARRSGGCRPRGSLPRVGRSGLRDGSRVGSGRGVGDMSTNGRRRVVITGMGAVTPNGLTMAETWASIRAGKSGVGRVEGFDMPEGTVNIAGQVKNFDPAEYMDRRTVRKTDRFAQLSVAAASQAVADADLDIAADASRIGCS